uniref:Uncharacterized protein n=1 Tax=Morchella importuna TaxID=1174673 RepID=A0A650AFE4_9PEZI|nr:hypothetical protein [Morchella importuna]QGN66765.1 hypothetical protein [Morchella importuna]
MLVRKSGRMEGGPKRGKRKIDLALSEAGLDSFCLDFYILPKELLENCDKVKIRNLSLCLEQLWILLLNPEYNVVKVAGSNAGYKHSDESIENNKIRNSKAAPLSLNYLYI